MPDREFDKSVQRKANELRMEPSPEVWERVAAQLKEKDRKRGAAWIWLAAAMVAGGLSLWFFGPSVLQQGTSSSQQAQQAQQSQQAPAHTSPSLPAQAATSTQESTPLNKPTISHEATSTSTSGSLITKQETIQLRGQQSALSGSNTRAGKKARPATTTKEQLLVLREQQTAGAKDWKATEEAVLQGKLMAMALEKPGSGTVEPTDAKEGDTKLDAALLASTPEQPTKKQAPWNLALQVGGGSGSMREGLATSYAPRFEYMAAGNALQAPGTAVAADPTPSDVKPGPSFQASIAVSRPVGRKTSFITGLQYAFFSNRIEVGRKIDSSAMNSNFRMQAIQGIAAYTGVGNNGKTYYNTYHYLQLPLEIGWALDAQKRLSWNNGIVLGYLLSTDALHYDETAGAYYKNNDLVNKFQTSAQTSFQYRLFPGKTWSLSVGPYLNYQLRNIDRTADSKRLLTVGFNARLLLGTSK